MDESNPAPDPNRWKNLISNETDKPYKSIEVLSNGDERVREGLGRIGRWRPPRDENSELAKTMRYIEREVEWMHWDSNARRGQPVEVLGGIHLTGGSRPFDNLHMAKGHLEPAAMKDLFRLIKKDLTGTMGEWLGSDGVSFYFEMMKLRNNKMLAIKAINGYKGPLLNCYFFPVQFYWYLYQVDNKDKKKIKKYNFQKPDGRKGAKLRGNVFERDLLFMLVNKKGNHWTLVVVNFLDKRIEYFDGFEDDDTEDDDTEEVRGTVEVNHMRRWLKDEKIRLTNGKDTWDDSEWTYHSWHPDQGRPVQEDGFNCGVIALQIANYYAQNGRLDFGEYDWPRFRRMMVAEIIEGKLFDKDNRLGLEEGAPKKPLSSQRGSGGDDDAEYTHLITHEEIQKREAIQKLYTTICENQKSDSFAEEEILELMQVFQTSGTTKMNRVEQFPRGDQGDAQEFMLPFLDANWSEHTTITTTQYVECVVGDVPSWKLEGNVDMSNMFSIAVTGEFGQIPGDFFHEKSELSEYKGCLKEYDDKDIKEEVDKLASDAEKNAKTRQMTRINLMINATKNKPKKAIRHTEITKLSSFFLVQLKIFDYSNRKITDKKINNKIDLFFDFYDGTKYVLCGIVGHSGVTLDSGHYIAYLLSSTDSNRWHRISDENVSFTTFQDILRQTTPYILVYCKESIFVTPEPVVGIQNFDNTCFVNSTLQILQYICKVTRALARGGGDGDGGSADSNSVGDGGSADGDSNSVGDGGSADGNSVGDGDDGDSAVGDGKSAGDNGDSGGGGDDDGGHGGGGDQSQMRDLKRRAIQEAEMREDEVWEHYFNFSPKLPLMAIQKSLKGERELSQLNTSEEVKKYIGTLRNLALPPIRKGKQELPRHDLKDDLTRRPNLYLAGSKVAPNQYGLFTSARIDPGEFIIMYTGVFFDKETWEHKLDDDVRDYVFAEYRITAPGGPDGAVNVVAPMETLDQGKNLLQHPAAAINEPSFGNSANAYAVTIMHGDHTAFGIFSCATIPSGEEIFWSYGPKFQGDYKPGKACKEEDEQNMGFDFIGTNIIQWLIDPFGFEQNRATEEHDDAPAKLWAKIKEHDLAYEECNVVYWQSVSSNGEMRNNQDTCHKLLSSRHEFVFKHDIQAH